MPASKPPAHEARDEPEDEVGGRETSPPSSDGSPGRKPEREPYAQFCVRRFSGVAGRRLIGLLLVVILATSACAVLPTPVPEHAYSPDTTDPRTKRLSETLYRAAIGAGDDPGRYSFAMLKTRAVTAVAADEGVFYFSEGLAAQAPAHVDAFVAHEVAHEVLGHAGTRRALSLGVSGGFVVIGFVVPGLGLMDFFVNPVIVRAFTRDQTFDADQKAVEILRAMGHDSPRRTLAAALKAAAVLNGPANAMPLLATEPDLDERLAALEPLEPEPVWGSQRTLRHALTP